MWVCFFYYYSLLNLLQYCFCLCFGFFGLEACGTLSPQAGMEPAALALEGQSPNHWTAREFPESNVILKGRNWQPKGPSVPLRLSKQAER